MTEQDVSRVLQQCLEEEGSLEAPWVPYAASQAPEHVAGRQGPDDSGGNNDVLNAQHLMHHISISRQLHETGCGQAGELAGDENSEGHTVLNLAEDMAPLYEQARNRIRREQVRLCNSLSLCAAA